MATNKNTTNHNLTRGEVMDFLRQKTIHEILSPDDCCEIFLNILGGSSDITKELLDQLLNNYGITHIEVKTIDTSIDHSRTERLVKLTLKDSDNPNMDDGAHRSIAYVKTSQSTNQIESVFDAIISKWELGEIDYWAEIPELVGEKVGGLVDAQEIGSIEEIVKES